MQKDFTVVDLETTGLDCKREKITEIAAIKVVDGQIQDRFHTFVNPGRSLSEFNKELTGLSDDKLKDAPSIEEVIDDFVAFEDTGCLLGHSVLFDFSFLKRAAVNHGLSFERQGIDTLKIARKYLPTLESRGLPFLCQHFQIPHQAHRAMSDTEATLMLYKILWERFGDDADAASVFSPSSLIYQVKKESPISKKQIEQLKRFIRIRQVKDPYDVELLTKSEASRYLDELIVQYGKVPPRNEESDFLKEN